MRVRNVVLVAAAGAAGYFIAQSTRAFLETAPYEVVSTDGPFEIRDYPALPVVSGPMQAGADEDGVFMRLFGFISRKNDRNQKISMTTPVFIDKGENKRMSFVMPREVAADVPAPADPALQVERRPAARVAVYRFKTSMGERAEEQAADRLRTWVDGKGLATTGAPIVAYYDAPWLPGPLRRNEVMLELQ